MALLSRAQILAANDRKFQTVDVPEWGGEVRVGSMTALQRDRYFAAVRKFQQDGKEGVDSPTVIVVAAAVVDEDGGPIFAPDDIVDLGKKDATAVQRVFDAASELNKLTPKSVEAEQGNS